MYSCVLLELSREVHGTSRLIDRASRSEYGLFQGRTHTTSAQRAAALCALGLASGPGARDSRFSRRTTGVRDCRFRSGYIGIYLCGCGM
jgi:hypothetical protein